MTTTASISAGLNPAQRQAVEAGDGPALILAGPGSGKTRVLTHRVAYLVAERGIDPYNILAVTFTNKAASEMKARLARLIEERVKQLTVGTFHSICVRILRREGENAGIEREFAIYDDDDQTGIIKQALLSLKLDSKQYTPRSFQNVISKAKNELITPAEYAKNVSTYWEELAARVYKKYQELLQANHALDFDDLIMTTVAMLDSRADVLARYQERYQHVLVDEYQDTNHAQYVLVKLLAGKHRNIFVVGDPDQSVYSWRSADIRNILNFETDYPDARVILLEQNYRSTQNILDVAQSVIVANTQRKDKGLWTENASGLPINVYEAYNEEEEARFVVAEIQRLQQSGRAQAKECAVMYRTNAQSRALEEAFIRYNVPYQLVGGVKFYERREVKDVLAFLRLMVNPFDGLSLARVINNTPFGRGIGSGTWSELERWAASHNLPVYTALQMVAASEGHGSGDFEEQATAQGMAQTLDLKSNKLNALSTLARTLDEFIALKHDTPLPQLVAMVLDRGNFFESLRDGSDEGDERWRNVQELLTVAQGYIHLEGAEALTTFLEDVALISDLDKLKEDNDATTLITLHAAKGLEFKVVFIVGMEDEILPHRNSLDRLEALEEERRLAYVGITRAMERLYLIYTFKRTLYGNTYMSRPSRFLLDIPRELLKGNITVQRRDEDEWGSDEYAEGDRPDIQIAGGKRGSGNSSSHSATSRTASSVKRSGTHNAGNGNYRTYNGRSSYQNERAERLAASNSVSTFKSQSPTKPRDPGAAQFSAGMKVNHPSFGEGIVVSSKPTASDEEVTVAFVGKGVKKLLASLAKMERI